MIQCMGGWCRSRNECAHYVAPPIKGMAPRERLCGEQEQPEPIDREQWVRWIAWQPVEGYVCRTL